MSKARKPEFFFGWWVVTGGFLLTSTYGFFYTLTVFFDELQKEFLWSATLISSIHSVHLLTTVFSSLLVGWLVQKYDPRLVLGINALFSGGGIALLSQVHSIGLFYTLYALATFAAGAMVVPMAIVQRWFIAQRGLALGIVVAGFGLGALVHPPLAHYLIDFFGWRTAYLIEGGITFLIVALGASVMVAEPAKKGLTPYGAEGKKLANLTKQSEAIISWSLKEAIRNKAFILIGIACLFIFLSVHLLMVHIIPFLISPEVGIPKATASFAWGLAGGVSIAGRLIMGGLGPRIGWRQAAGLCCGVLGATLLWLTQVRSEWVLFIFVIIYGFFFGGRQPQIPGLLGSYFGTGSLLPMLLAINLTISMIGGALGPPLAGFIYDQTRSYSIAFLVAAISWAIAALLFFFVIKPPQRYGDPKF